MSRLHVLSITLLIVIAPASAARVVFNDRYPDTQALEIWQLTDDPTTKHHSMYHNMTPFSHDGRYCFYVIVYRGPRREGAPENRSLGIYDLHEDREIGSHMSRAYTPIWGNRSNAMYFVDDQRKRNATLYRLEVPSLKMAPLHTGPKKYCPAISFDDKYIFGAEDGKLYRYENRERGEKKLIYTPPKWPNVKVSIPKGSPTKPWIMCRQNTSGRDPNCPVGTPSRIIVDVDGNLVNPALPYTGHAHADWHASGDAVLRGDGPLMVRRVLDPWPGDLLPLNAVGGGDPARQGASGRWGATNRFANGVLWLSDLRSGRSWPVVRTVSHIHQPASDTRDLSGPYDCDQHGSPDGTKMYFSTNYDIRNYPVALVTEPASANETEAITVDSTEGFPDSGLLSFFGEVIRYEPKTPTRFRRLTRGYLGTRPRWTIEGWPISNYHGRADEVDGKDALAHQHQTDAYIAVVRLPDAPVIRRDGNTALLCPGRNHRETRALVLYRDGKRDRDLLASRGDQTLDLGEGKWTTTAAEWSRLESRPSKETVAGPVRLSVRWQRPKELDAPRVRHMVGNKEVAKLPGNADSVSIYSDEAGDYLWEVRKSGEVVERRWATPGYPATLMEKYRRGVRVERRIFDGNGVETELVCKYDDGAGRLTELRKRSWDGGAWDTLAYENGRLLSRTKTALGRYEHHYGISPTTGKLERKESYVWKGGTKVRTFPK